MSSTCVCRFVADDLRILIKSSHWKVGGHNKWQACSSDISTGSTLMWHCCRRVVTLLCFHMQIWSHLCPHSKSISLNFSMLNGVRKRFHFMTVLPFFPNPFLNELPKWKSVKLLWLQDKKHIRIFKLYSMLWSVVFIFHFSLFDVTVGGKDIKIKFKWKEIIVVLWYVNLSIDSTCDVWKKLLSKAG